MQIFGDTSGLSPSDKRLLEYILRRRVPFDELVTSEFVRNLAAASHSTRRQVGALINRAGEVVWVVIGDAAGLMLPDLGRSRAGSGRFRGLRLVHTHLRREPLTHDDLVDLTRLRLDLVAAICLTPEGEPQTVYYAHAVPVPEGGSEPPFRQYGPVPYAKLDCNPEQLVLDMERAFADAARMRTVRPNDGRAILVQVATPREASEADDVFAELAELARTAGVEVVDRVLQVRPHPDPKFVLGKGKLQDVNILAMQRDAEVLIFSSNLSPAQSAAISARTDLKVLDRTQLILDIFAQRAESRDGKLQVELAQMKYLLPRLGAKDDSLSRLTGGIGGRGPGETKLEIGRRRARDRITQLEKELKSLSKKRIERRGRRVRRDVPVVAIVGYTNAGKSTLLNALTNSETLVEDKLFATLDTRSRRLRFPREREVVLVDTVGFIRELPKDLFAAFRATFEEAHDADLLLHVIDAASASRKRHLDTTEEVLIQLSLEKTPRLEVYNKADLLGPGEAQALAEQRGGIAVSARDRATLKPLLDRMERMLEYRFSSQPVSAEMAV